MRKIDRNLPGQFGSAWSAVGRCIYGHRNEPPSGSTLNFKREGKAFLLPLSAPLGTVFDPPIDLRQFKSDVVPLFLGLVPLMPHNLLVLSSEFSVEQGLFHQIVCRVRLVCFA